MSFPATTVETYDRGVMTVNYEPVNAQGVPCQNRAVVNETLPATVTLGRQTTAYNSNTILTIPGERPAPGQE